jgi:cytochrome c-type biogenesis protein CcmE
MNKHHKRRIYLFIFFITGLALAAGLIIYALSQNMNAFVTPHQLADMKVSPDYHLRLGGMVKKDSLLRDTQGLGMQFVVTDFKDDIKVRYVGVLPDLFREGKGVVAEGYRDANGEFIASQVLAKHDENYMPRKVKEEIEEKNT